MKGIAPDGYLRLDEVLETVANAAKTSPELGNVVERTTRILNHVLRFNRVRAAHHYGRSGWRLG